ncbi:hypothetical protein [Chelativorans alearense]|uniref:hypothetical protein n=1 Tax=Chelativorans alearense TaxID=2681495 RepID=UPI0013D8293F|nr:hypothetical protein [Chelativorans alearense]
MPEESEYPRSMRQDETPSSRTQSTAAAKDFVLARWRGEAPLTTVFWRDMLLAGSLVNLIAALGAMALLASKAPLVVALLLFFAPLPMNLFLFIAVWRCGGSSSPLNAFFARLGATIWLIAATAL